MLDKELKEKFDREISNNNRTGIISHLTTICLLDKNFSTQNFENALKYVENFPDLFVQYDNTLPLYNSRIDAKEKLTDDDYADAIGYLKLNFCKERIEDVKKLGKYLNPATQSSIATEAQKKTILDQPQSTKPIYTSPHTETTSNKSGSSKILVYAGVAAAALAFVIWLAGKSGN